MTKFEKIVTVIGSTLGVLGTAFVMGAAWNTIDSRFERVDGKIATLMKANSTPPCIAILGRQIEAIEKNRRVAREALEELSEQYNCTRYAAFAAANAAWLESGQDESIFTAAIRSAFVTSIFGLDAQTNSQ